MIPTRRQAGVAALVIAAAAAAGVGTYISGSAAAGGNGSKAVCGAPAAGDARCNSRLLTKDGQVVTRSTPAGYGPADIQSAYNLTSSSAGAGQTVAIVDAYDDPNAVADVNHYRNQFGLSACAGSPSVSGCTLTNGATITKLNQAGNKGPYPRSNGGWAQEISLDLDMVSAVCPACSIVLVEANSASMIDLGTGVNTAVAKGGAHYVSNSYGGGESTKDLTYDQQYFTHTGVVITASSGDNGFGVEYPAASSLVTAVGGTSLSHSSGSWSETAWSGAGSGCSSVDPKPAWQTASTSCSMRAVADVSAVADPNTGVAVYDSLRFQGASGWLVFGGTSVASPLVASVYALAGNAATANAGTAWSLASSLHDVTSGSNGNCSTSVWCNAGTGWDGPTGLGTPNGTSAF